MAKRKHTKAFDRLLQEIVTFINQQSSQFMRWLLRTYIIMQRWQQQNAGFVLPTTVFMLMVVFLVVTAIMFRTFNRTSQVIREGQTQIVKNAATPAVDRAKSKIEYLFTVDVQTPDVPNEESLEILLENDDKYTYPGETRVGAAQLGLVGVTNPVAVWKYQTDITGDNDPTDPEDLTTIYAIVSRSVRGGVSVYPSNDSSDDQKASAFVARNGPLLGEGANDPSCTRGSGGAVLPGWFEQGTAHVYKAFQVYAVTVPNAVLSGNPTNNNSIATIQYQQDRRYSRLNKWGAWFRSDLDVYPGDPFNWNGAMYSHSNLFFAGGSGGTRKFRAFLISSEASCFFNPSTNSVLQTPGQIVSAKIRDGQFLAAANADIHTWDSAVNIGMPTIVPFGSGLDSIDNGSNPIDIAADPVRLHTENVVVPRREDGTTWQAAEGVQSEDLVKRTDTQAICAPYVDDTYRADNRYGPKPTYSKETLQEVEENGETVQKCIPAPSPEPMGTVITANPPNLNLISDDPSDPDLPDDVGLDGYWERRARHQGLRVIVGQRLELGNSFGWQGDDDPLYPPDTANPLNSRRNEIQQYRTLRDNLASVQATAIYHHNEEDGYYPIAYVATTVHPSNEHTLKSSSTFLLNNDNDLPVITNFFNGQGTNGWEFTPYDAGDFDTMIGRTQPLGKALRNLAKLAGDPNGAFPITELGGEIHPYPLLTMWGNFSNLRETICPDNDCNAAINYGNLSIADKSNLHTAAGTLGMLAYNINLINNYTPSTTELNNLRTAIGAITLPPSDTDIAQKLTDNPEETPDYILTQLDAEVATDPDNEQNRRTAALAHLLHLRGQIQADRQNEYSLTDVACPAPLEGDTDLEKLCPPSGSEWKPKFPALYYIFPATTHDEAAEFTAFNNSRAGDSYIRLNNVNGNVNYEELDDNDIEDIALVPKPNNNTWEVPSQTNTANSPVNQISVISTANNETSRYVAFMDKAMFDGREMMNVRVLDIDLNLLRDNEQGDDSWLPSSGIVYAFREDAVREDAIIRPTDSAFANSISTKPVDYYPDPERRPYGFRLKNGRNLLRTGFGDTDEENQRGLTFVSDNPVYVQGHFNLHTNNNTATRNDLEEFTPTMPVASDGTYTEPNFYGRTNRNDNFADFGNDNWRVSEILGDSVNILSGRFCDGTIESGLFDNNRLSDCTGSGNQRSSYQNSNMWSRVPTDDLECENPFDPRPDGSGNTNENSCLGPVKVFRNGQVQINGTPYTSYRNFSDNNRNLSRAEETYINAVLVSGIVPSRQNQGNGGFHNFPRLNEYWGGTTLGIQGSFLQLNFSTYATGPYDQDAWEPNQNPVSGGGSSGEYINFYIQGQGTSRTAPNRRWGYDVGLQFHPAGAASKRMVQPDSLRGEFYREPPANDSYICMLRQGLNYPCQ
jgi:hypothetical protein